MDGQTDPQRVRHPEKVHRPDNPIQRKPDWIRVKAPNSAEYFATQALVREHKLNTVCEEAACAWRYGRRISYSYSYYHGPNDSCQ